jgi:hypothetical protein
MGCICATSDERESMEITSFEFIGAFLSTCVVLAFVRVNERGLFPVRYSVRTLLIATTLVAVVLGLIMWSIK